MKVFVGNLPFSVTDDKLKELFSSYGEISESMVIQNKFSGRSKGFGFVTFKEEEAGKKAISEMNGKDMEGREITVSEAKPMDPDKPRTPRRFDNNSRGRFDGDRGGRDGGSRGRFNSDRPRRF